MPINSGLCPHNNITRQSTVSGAGDGGGCVPRMEAAFIPALPNSGHCAGALSDIADTFTGCLANPNETSCNAGTHYMHANDTHDSVHVCEWSCGQCVPSTAFAESLDTAQYPVAAAFMPNDGECTCAAAVAVCPSRPPTAGIVTVMTASPVGVALTAPPVEGAAPNAPPTAPPVSSSPVDGAPAPAPTTPATYIVRLTSAIYAGYCTVTAVHSRMSKPAPTHLALAAQRCAMSDWPTGRPPPAPPPG